MSANAHAWAVDGNDMRTRSRRGGRTALNGYEFQAAHAVHLITQLLTCEGGLIQVRYEGAQDIDMMFGDGRQLFIQYKETSGIEYTFDVMRDILHGFMRDTIDACGHPPDIRRLANLKLEFLHVSTGVFVGTEMLRLIRKSYTKILAAKLIKGFAYAENSVAKASDLKAFAEYVLKNVSVRLSSKLEGHHEPALLATARLALFGVPAARIGVSMARLKELLTPPRNSFAADVASCLDGLADFHPASGRSPISMLPSENIFPTQTITEQEFRESGRVSWQAIHYKLDVARDAALAIRKNFLELGKASGVVLVSGASGSGKSTVIRRVAWDIHRAGGALVFEITNPSALTSQAWDEVVRLAELASKPAVIVIDDIGVHPQVLDELRRNPYSKVIVIASDRDERCIPKTFPVHVALHRLDVVSNRELTQLANQLDKRINPKQRIKLSSFMQDGEMFALSLALRGSSLNGLADSTLTRVNELVPQLSELFLCLCACGVYDQAVPKSLLTRILPSMAVWNKARAERFVFDEVNDRLRSGHATLAVSILAKAKPDVIRLKMMLLEQVDTSDVGERRFGLGLLQNGLADHAIALARFPTQLAAFADSLANVGDYLDLRRCARVIEAAMNAGAIGLEDARERLLAVIGADRVRTGHDAVLFMKEAVDYEATFAVVARVFAQPNISFGRSSFMRWVTEKGRGNVELQRQAVALHFAWLRRREFPVPETVALINCINQGNPKLPPSAVAEFAEVLQIILDEMEFSLDRQPELELLYIVCETIYTRLRSQKLFVALLDGVRNNFGNAELAGNPYLLRYLARAARQAGKAEGRDSAFKLIAPLLPKVAVGEIRSVFMILLMLVPNAKMVFMVEWTKRFQTVKPAGASALAKDFVQALPQHLMP